MSIYLRKRKKKRGYAYDIVSDVMVDGVRTRKYKHLPDGTTKQEAEMILNKLKIKTSFGADLINTIEPILLETYIDKYYLSQLTEENFSPSTIRSHLQAINGAYGLRKNFGHFYITAISVADIQEYVDRRLATGVKSKTVKNVLGVLKGILEDAVRMGFLPQDGSYRNPVPLARFPKHEKEKFDHEVYSMSEVLDMITVAESEKNYRMVFLLVLTCLCGGLRKSECIPVKWSDFEYDSEKKIYTLLTLRRTAVISTKNKVVIKETGKTKNALRTIPISPMASKLLTKARNWQNLQKLQTADWAGEDYLFTMYSGNGELIKPNYLYNDFRRWIRKHNFPQHRLHDLRGTFITWAFQSGMSPYAVANIVGHSSPEFSYQRYAKIDDTYKTQEAKKLEEQLQQVM